MMTSDNVFCDTNVVIRLNVAETPEHEQVKAATSELIAAGNVLWISRQVLREFCSVLTRPQTFPIPVSRKDVIARARALATLFSIADEDEQVTQNLFRLIESVPIGGKQVHDANIVATMQANGIRWLFTLNPSDFGRFSPSISLLTVDDLLPSATYPPPIPPIDSPSR